MKLSSAQYDHFCTTPSNGVAAFLLYGDDPFLTGRNLSLFYDKQHLMPSDIDVVSERSILKEEIFLNDFFMSPGLFAQGGKYLHIRDATDKIVPYVAEFLQKTPLDKPRFFLESAYLGPRSKLRSLFEKENNAAVLPCYALTEREMRQMILSRATAADKELDAQALDFLVRGFCDTPSSINMEWEKLILYMGGENRIGLEDVQQISSQAAAGDIYMVAQAFLQNDVPELYRVLMHIQDQSGFAAVSVIRSVAQQLLRLLHIRLLQQQGLSADQACQSVSPVVPAFQRRNFLAHLQRWPVQRVRKTLHTLVRLEVALKQHGDMGKQILIRYLVQLAAKK